MKKIGRIMAIIAAIFAVYGCSVPAVNPAVKPEDALANHKQEKTILIKGEIDFVKEVEIFSPANGETVVTLIGFNSGEGTIVSGIQPGIKEGKKVKIYLGDKISSYKGSPVYEITRIEPLTEN